MLQLVKRLDIQTFIERLINLVKSGNPLSIVLLLYISFCTGFYDPIVLVDESPRKPLFKETFRPQLISAINLSRDDLKKTNQIGDEIFAENFNTDLRLLKLTQSAIKVTDTLHFNSEQKNPSFIRGPPSFN